MGVQINIPLQYPTTNKNQQALRFFFGRGNSVKSESLEIELESAKTFARDMLLDEWSTYIIKIIILVCAYWGACMVIVT